MLDQLGEDEPADEDSYGGDECAHQGHHQTLRLVPLHESFAEKHGKALRSG